MVSNTPPPPDEGQFIDADEYQQATGERLERTLDLNTWASGEDLPALYARLETEVADAVRQQDDVRRRIRSIVFPRIKDGHSAAPDAGVYQATPEEIEQVHRSRLFNGLVEACDGTSVVHDTLPLTITQIGVCLVSYQGDHGSWVHRLYRRDLRVAGADPVDEMVELLERRRQRAGVDQESQRDLLTSLGRRGIMAYAERAVLLRKATAPWRMGHGSPAPYELLTGSGMRELLARGLELLEELVWEHQRFVFVPSAPTDRMLLTIGDALHPLEYVLFQTLDQRLFRIVEHGHYRGDWAQLVGRVKQFTQEAGRKIVSGVFRASRLAPAQVFYAHADHAHGAALIAMADSVLQEHRGFPLLIDLADTVCSTTFGTDALAASAEMAYTEAGSPYRYESERHTRP